MNRARTRKHALRVVPTLAHIQAYERRFGRIDGETFRELSAALAAVHGDRRYAVNNFRAVMGEAISSRLCTAQSMSAISKQLQHSSTLVSEYYADKQNT